MAVKPPEIVKLMRDVSARKSTPETALRHVLLQSLQPLHREAFTICEQLRYENQTNGGVFTSLDVLDKIPLSEQPSRSHMALIMAQLQDLGLIEQVGNIERLKIYRLPGWMQASGI